MSEDDLPPAVTETEEWKCVLRFGFLEAHWTFLKERFIQMLEGELAIQMCESHLYMMYIEAHL